MAFRSSPYPTPSELHLSGPSGPSRSGRISSLMSINDASSKDGYSEATKILNLTYEEFEGLDHSARKKHFSSMR